MNKVIFTGRIGKDPEVKYTPKGTMVCNTSLAVDVWTGEKETNWYNLAIFGESFIERFKKFVKKGAYIVIEGDLVLRKWIDKDGVKHVSPDVTVRDFDLAEWKTNEQEGTPYDE